MAANDDDDDFFSDDDLDALPANALQDLEQNAVLATQQVNPLLNPSRESEPPQPQLPLPTPAKGKYRQVGDQFSRTTLDFRARQGGALQSSSDYGHFDNDTLNEQILNESDASETLQAHANQYINNDSTHSMQHGQWQPHNTARHSVLDEVVQLPGEDPGSALTGNTYYGNVEVTKEDIRTNVTDHNDEDVLDLRGLLLKDSLAQRDELRRENESLQKNLKIAKQNVLIKGGEIAVVRGKLASIEKDHQARIEQLQKDFAARLASHKEQLDAANRKAGGVAVDNSFVNADLVRMRQLEGGPRNANHNSQSKNKANGTLVTTPKKTKALPYRDGFEDDEMMLVSPTKVAGKPKPATPRAGNKRKRPVVDDSPARPLQLSQSHEQTPSPRRGQDMGSQANNIVTSYIVEEDTRSELFKFVMNYRAPSGKDRIFELLAGFGFPSSPGKRLSSILLDNLLLSGVVPGTNPTSDICHPVLALWSQCMREKFYKPLPLIVDLLMFVLGIDNSIPETAVTELILELAQSTVEIVGHPRLKRQALPTFSSDLNVTACLSLLEIVAEACVMDPQAIKKFWDQLRWDFVLMELQYQSIEDTSIMLSILATSILPESFGPVFGATDADRKRSEVHVIDHVTLLLADKPKIADREDGYLKSEIKGLKLGVLHLLRSMTQCEYGGRALAIHPHAFARLVWLVNDELEALYDYRDCQSESAKIINMTIRVMFHLMKNYEQLINIQTKLAVMPGGHHKYLVSLTRLAFSEGLVLEAGINSETIDAAHQLLEIEVTPEEGEALYRVFSSAVK